MKWMSLLFLGVLVSCGGQNRSVRIDLPLPPKLDLSEYDQLYVTGFVTDVVNEEFDVDWETVNFFKREFRNNPVLELIEEEAEDLSEKDPRAFFTRQQPYFQSFNFPTSDNVLALTGVITFESLDRSGFREVKGTDNLGRNYYRTQFVEITGFNLGLRVYVYDVNTGKLLYRELLSDSMELEGINPDSKLVFYDLMQRVSDRVMGLFSQTLVKAERNLL